MRRRKSSSDDAVDEEIGELGVAEAARLLGGVLHVREHGHPEDGSVRVGPVAIRALRIVHRGAILNVSLSLLTSMLLRE